MALKLHIPSCIRTPAHCFHPPPFGEPMRIQIEGPLTCVEKLLPGIKWHLELSPAFPQLAGPLLAELAYKAIYQVESIGKSGHSLVVRDEYLGWVREVRPLR